jgi:hypothetical protein
MFESRVRARCQKYMKGLFRERPGTQEPTHHVHRAAQRHGITGLVILKKRRDKVIARGEHPEWGEVALKTLDPVADPMPARAGLYTDRFVADHPARFLPAIHAFGLGYSVSEWIDGGHVHEIGAGSMKDLPVLDFVDELAAWCTSRGEDRQLEASAVLSSVRFYVETTVRRMGYRSAANCLEACVRFRREVDRIGGHVDRMVALAPELCLRETPMFSDVQVGNVLFSGRDHRLVLVDFEALRPGNWLFDVVFLMSSLVIHQLPRRLLETLAGRIFSPDFMPTDEVERFFRSFAAYVTETYMTIDGRGRREIEARLDMIGVPGE